jgi:hypothetical protein
VQAPPTQAKGQPDAAPHCPFAPQVCTPLPEHCVAPGVHEPEQAPPTHAWLLHAEAAPQAPVLSHVCTPLPEHCVVPGAHEPVQEPLMHA